MPDFTIPQGDMLVAPGKQSWVEAALNRLLAHDFFAPAESPAAAAGGFWDERMAWARPYSVVNGRLTVPVQGVLLSGFPYQFGGYATGYEYILAAVERGVEDTNVREIVLDINSPGGSAAGCFDCSDALYAMRGEKPIRAHAREHAYSAAYSIASAADEIAVARTGGVGSIGVIAAHVEMSAALEQHGLNVTLIYAGAKKADGHPAVPLSDEARADMQRRTDAIYEIFVSTVARNRGMDEQAVRDTEAATFMAREAIEAGLADSQGDLGSLSANADPLEYDEDEEMSNPDASTVEPAVTAEALAETQAAAREEGLSAGRAAERERIAAILDSEEAAERPNLARKIALTTGMTPEEASVLLGAAAVETREDPAPAPSAFVAHMNDDSHPEVGGNEPGGSADAPRHERVLSTVRSLGLAGYKQEAN